MVVADYGSVQPQSINIKYFRDKLINFDPSLVNDISLLYGTAAETKYKQLVNKGEILENNLSATMVDARTYSSPQAAIDAAPAGTTVWFDPSRVWTLTEALTVTKPLTIQGRNTLISQTGIGKAGFTVTSSDVHFDGLDLLGRQSSVLNGSERALDFVGTSAGVRLTRTRVSNCRIRRWGYAGIFASFISRFVWDNLIIEDIGYMGAGTISGEAGKFTNSSIDTITQATGAVNSYGVAFSHNETLIQALAPRSANIECNNVRVSNVPLWEGFDTHGGINISFINCQSYNCKFAMAIVPARDGGASYVLAPKNILVQGCILESGRTDGQTTIGINLVGCSSGLGFHNNIDYATGIISGNILIGFGNQAASSGSALSLQDTLGAVVSGNTFIESATAAIRLDYNNRDAVIVGNTATDVWTNTGTIAAMIHAPSAYNTFKATGNTLTRGNRVATTVNAQGLRLGSASATSCVEGENDFSSATTPYTGTNGLIRHDRRGIQDGFVTALPTLGIWQRASQALSTVPTASTSPGWVCVTAGGATSVTWAASLAYGAATWARTSTGKVIECITAGTSGTVEPNPSSIGELITDGTAVWIYRSPTTAVFKALPALAA